MLDQFRAQKIEWNRANNQIYERIEASGGDSNGRTMFVQMFNGSMVEDLTGASLMLAWNKNGFEQGLESFEPIDASKGQFLLYYPTGMLANHGTLTASLILVDVTGRIESKPFDIIVHKSTVDDDAVASDDRFTALTTALVKVSQVQAEFDGLYADKSEMMDQLKVDKSAEMDQLKASKSAEMDQLKADKTSELDQLYNDKNQALTGLETDFADKAEALEQTYAPRLTDVESGLVDLGSKSIVESGTHADGSWTKFGDGLMIVNVRIQDLDITDVPNNTDAVITLDNPIDFMGTPSVSIGGYFTNANGDTLHGVSVVPMVATGTVNGQYLTFSVGNKTGKTITKVVGFNAIAIGRWK